MLAQAKELYDVPKLVQTAMREHYKNKKRNYMDNNEIS